MHTFVVFLEILLLAGLVVTNSGSFLVRKATTQTLKSVEIRNLLPSLWIYKWLPGGSKTPSSRRAVIFIPGGMANILAVEKPAAKLARKLNCPVFVAETPHGIPAPFEWSWNWFLDRFAYAQYAMIQREGIQEAHFVVHSAGASVFMRLLKILEEAGQLHMVKSVTAWNPSGSIGKDGLIALMWRFMGKSVPDENRLHERRAWDTWWPSSNNWRRGPHYYIGLSMIQTALESKAFAAVDNRPGFERLKELGIPVKVYAGEHDLVYPLPRIQRTLGGYVTVRVVENGRHQTLLLDYEEASERTGNSILEMEARGSK